LANGVLFITSAVTGTINKGQALVNASLLAGSCIGAQLTGTSYQINNYLIGYPSTQTLASSGSPVAFTTSNGNLNVSGIGRFVFYPGDNADVTQLHYYIQTIGTPYISQFAVTHVDDEMAWVLDPYALTPQFKTVMAASKMSVIRDLEYSNSITSLVTTWASRKPLTYYAWAGSYINPAYVVPGTVTHANGTVLAISATSWASGTATITTTNPHGQSGSFYVSIWGVLPVSPAYNGTFYATVTGANTLTYALASQPGATTTFGSCSIGVTDYAVTFADPISGISAPYDKQILQFYFDVMGHGIYSGTATWSGTTTVNFTNHPFVGGEKIIFFKNGGNSNLPTGVSQGVVYYVLAAGLVAGTSFQFSLTPGGSAVTFSGASGNTTVSQVHTLNLNGTGSVPLINVTGAGLVGPFSTGGQISYQSGGSGNQGTIPCPNDYFNKITYATAVYDADVGAWLMVGGNGTGSGGLGQPCPVEGFLKLCKDVGAHPWFSVPFMALDPMTDYIRNFAHMLKTNAPSWMIPRIEGPNELWNFVFQGTGYANTKANIHWGTGNFDYNNWYGKVISTIGQDFVREYGDGTLNTAFVGNGYQIVIGSQVATWVNTAANSNGNSNRYLASGYTGQAAAAQTGYNKDTAIKWSTHGCAANYWNPTYYNTSQGTTVDTNAWLADGFSSKCLFSGTNITLSSITGTPKIGQTIVDRYGLVPANTTIMGGSGTAWTISNSVTLPNTTPVYGWNTASIAAANDFIDSAGGAADSKFNIAQVVGVYFTALHNYHQTLANGAGATIRETCYEGGYGINYPGGNPNTFFEACKYQSEFGLIISGISNTLANSTTLTGQLNQLVTLGVEFPSQFTLCATNTAWSVMNDIYCTNHPGLDAIAAFNA
jgi:hypothetical protein